MSLPVSDRHSCHFHTWRPRCVTPCLDVASEGRSCDDNIDETLKRLFILVSSEEYKVLAMGAEEKGGGEVVLWQLMHNVG